ncbi:shikimate kinase [Weissella uvarum]|uniref:shikimate kinase n=1 Tax=Weissella uvarum TaxID=1479233 RepID=UPI0019605011|nr:shikimate kinase [Weissella uvarum]MBM7617168.1 shikimate kinase [Weissella uvarum]MCM0595464.1 shikimate kinase [Weissella uvarum]
MNSAILIGFMGAGKTTVGQLWSETVGRPFLDTDQVVEQLTQQTIPEFFENHAMPDFRELETRALTAFLEYPTGILATGGGIIDSSASEALLQQTEVPIIYLSAEFGTIANRLMDDVNRPILQEKTFSEVVALYRQRLEKYTALADYTIAVDQLTPAEIVEQLQAWSD